MKNIVLLLICLATSYSCTKETNDMTSTPNITASMGYTGTWELVKMTGSLVGQESTGNDMQWQETYIFNKDKTFVKTRVHGDSTTLASGTYQLKAIEEVGDRETRLMNIELFHNIENTIIGDCSSNKTKESLFFSTDHKLKNTWNQCDGPGLEYIKSK